MNLQPKGSSIFITRPERTTMDGAIHLPYTSKSNTTQFEGYIAAIGPDLTHNYLQPGDYVLYASYADTEAFEDPTTGEEYTIITEDVVLAFERMDR